MKIFITGGAGYCGSVLVPQLLDLNHTVTVYDSCFFGSNHLPNTRSGFNLIKGDIRNIDLLEKSLNGHEVFINLACISNDASFELNEALSTSINLDAFKPMVQVAKKGGVRRFIYASSSSVYGVSNSPQVTEEHELVPLTLYNKFKGMCEPLLLEELDDSFEGVIFRPATVCGYSPRQRLDVSVNILTNLAVNQGEITVYGGDQRRPNIHIQDYVDVVKTLISAPAHKIQGQIFNVGNENLKISEIAQTVKSVVEKRFPEKSPIKIKFSESDDARSYHINSDKIFNILGFKANRSIEQAVNDLCNAFELNLIPNSMDDSRYYNVKTLKEKNIQ